MDQDVVKSAECVIAEAGLSPAELITIVYGEIVRTGQIPIIPQVGTKDFNIARLTAASYSIPTVKVSIPEQKDAFLNDDGGY
ncbi:MULTISPECIES: damage-inducible protein J [Acinetobacter]|uniref:damage-inducible protein J n=1 Tax=Acinetobacter TaxID=469 RepID=UPI001E46326C|nr:MULTISPECIES: damage-inducible protein J [Acinetobacter]UXI50199.1 damage-inducible protein J [Acinetobacter variabilis]